MIPRVCLGHVVVKTERHQERRHTVHDDYKETTTACNACHVGKEHPFLAIKVPDATNYPDQEFRP
jgi:hypothetical protein